MFPEMRCTSRFLMLFLGYARTTCLLSMLEVGSAPQSSSSLEQSLAPQSGVVPPAIVPPKNRIAKPIYKKIAKVHNSMEGHWGLDICKRRRPLRSYTQTVVQPFTTSLSYEHLQESLQLS